MMNVDAAAAPPHHYTQKLLYNPRLRPYTLRDPRLGRYIGEARLVVCPWVCSVFEFPFT